MATGHFSRQGPRTHHRLVQGPSVQGRLDPRFGEDARPIDPGRRDVHQERHPGLDGRRQPGCPGFSATGPKACPVSEVRPSNGEAFRTAPPPPHALGATPERLEAKFDDDFIRETVRRFPTQMAAQPLVLRHASEPRTCRVKALFLIHLVRGLATSPGDQITIQTFIRWRPDCPQTATPMRFPTRTPAVP
jgi:hypothetical protein